MLTWFCLNRNGYNGHQFNFFLIFHLLAKTGSFLNLLLLQQNNKQMMYIRWCAYLCINVINIELPLQYDHDEKLFPITLYGKSLLPNKPVFSCNHDQYSVPTQSHSYSWLFDVLVNCWVIHMNLCNWYDLLMSQWWWCLGVGCDEFSCLLKKKKAYIIVWYTFIQITTL